MEVVLLPLNTMRRIQPLDTGAISEVIAIFRLCLLLHIFDNIEARKNSIFNLYISTAIIWVRAGHNGRVCQCRALKIAFCIRATCH